VSFGPTTPTLTRAATIAYRLVFAGPVSGLGSADLEIGGSARGCVVGAPSGSGASYTLNVTGCASGSLSLTLKPRVVRDAVANLGPGIGIATAAVRIDRLGPVAAKPVPTLRTAVTLGSSSTRAKLPVRLALTAADPGGAGVATYDVARSVNGKPYKLIASGISGPVLDTSLKPGKAYRFRVRARDALGNVGSWVVGPKLRPALVQQSNGGVHWKGRWSGSASSSFSGGSARSATASGALARYTFAGRAIGLVMTTAATRGQVKVYLDGSYVTTVDLGAAGWKARAIVFSRRWSSVGTHTIKLVAVGTAGRPRVDVDAFEVIR
jgi:hypothetical protein